MSVTERYKLTERKDNINNDSLLTSFYKRKIEDKKATEMASSHQRLHSQHQEDNKKLTQRTNASLKYRPENHKPNDSLNRVPSSTQLQMAGFISKHYQVPQKEKRTRGETQESLTSINCTTEASHKRCKSYNSNGFMHQAKSGNTPNEIKSTINKTDLKPQDKNPSKVRVPSSKGIRNDSFDNQLIKKSTTIDRMCKPTKESHLSKNKGNSSKFEASTKNYGCISDNDGVTSCSTWDLRKSTAYPTKSIMKGSSSKQANCNKPTSHKKNKSQNSSRIVSSRDNIII